MSRAAESIAGRVRYRRSGIVAHTLESVRCPVHPRYMWQDHKPLDAYPVIETIVPCDLHVKPIEEEQGDERAEPAEVGKLAMIHVILQERPKLPVNHLVALGHEDNLVTVMPML